MARPLDPQQLLDLGRAALEPTAADRSRIELALGARLDALAQAPQSGPDSSAPDLAQTPNAIDATRGLDLAAQGGWWSGAALKIGSAVVLVAAASAWWMVGSSSPAPVAQHAQTSAPVVATPALVPATKGGATSASATVAAAEPIAPAQAVVPAQPLAAPAASATTLGAAPQPATSQASAPRATLPAAPIAVARAAKRARAASVVAPSAQPSVASSRAAASAGAADVDEPQAQVQPEPAVLDPAPRPDLLMAELTLIDEASQALAAARPAQALDALERHRVLYGDGKLRVEREGLTALALCAAGRVDAARARAERFLQRHPSSPLVERVRGAAECEAAD